MFLSNMNVKSPITAKKGKKLAGMEEELKNKQAELDNLKTQLESAKVV